MEGTEVPPHFVVRADKPKVDGVVLLHPDDAGRLGDPSFKNPQGAFGVELLHTKTERGLASGVIRTNLTIGFMDQQLFLPREAMKLFQVPCFVDKPHSPFLDTALEDVVSRSCIHHDVARPDGEGVFEKLLIGFR